MSVHIISWVWKHANVTEPSDLVVLLALADWADDEGIAYPTREMIMKRCKVLSEQTIRRVIGRLVEAKAIDVQVGQGRGNRSVYRVLSGGGEKVPPWNLLANVKGSTSHGEKVPRDPDDIKDARPHAHPSPPLPPTSENPSDSSPTPKQEKHPACRIYRQLTRGTLNPARRAVIEKVISAEVDDASLERWGIAVTEWVGRGYRKENLSGMLEWWRDGVPARQSHHPSTNGRVVPEIVYPPPPTVERNGPPPTEEQFAAARKQLGLPARSAP